MEGLNFPYKAWHKEEKRIFEVSCIKFDKQEVWEKKQGNSFFKYKLKDLILMPYIWQKDKKFNSIYLHDVVSFKEESFSYLGVVSWSASITGGSTFYIEDYDVYKDDLNNDLPFYDFMGTKFSWNELEIVGSVFSKDKLIVEFLEKIKTKEINIVNIIDG